MTPAPTSILPTHHRDTSESFLAKLLPGNWVIEAGCNPPACHAPECLLDADCLGENGLVSPAMGLSITTATAFATDWGSALETCLARRGVRADPLLGLAVHELILNAVVHGNLNIKSGPSNDWADLDKRRSAILAALADESIAARAVSLAIGFGIDRVAAVIADEGAGYDAHAPRTARRASGRGLRIARAVGTLSVLRGGTQTAILAPVTP